MIVTEVLTLARKLNNFLESSATWDSTTEHKYVVPAGKRWWVIGGECDRDVSGTVVITFHDSADNQIKTLGSASAGVSPYFWPNATYPATWTPMVLDVGEYIKYFYGAAQSTVATQSCWVLEVDV